MGMVLYLLMSEHQVGQQVVVPDPHGLQHADGDHGGLEHREHDLEEGAQRAAAVDMAAASSISSGMLLTKPREHEHRQTRAEAQIHEHGIVQGVLSLSMSAGLGQSVNMTIWKGTTMENTHT